MLYTVILFELLSYTARHIYFVGILCCSTFTFSSHARFMFVCVHQKPFGLLPLSTLFFVFSKVAVPPANARIGSVQFHLCAVTFVQGLLCACRALCDCRASISMRSSGGDSGPPPPTEAAPPFAARRLRPIRCDRPWARLRPGLMRWLLLRCCIACPAPFWMLFIH